jgi:hypothetical protein
MSPASYLCSTQVHVEVGAPRQRLAAQEPRLVLDAERHDLKAQRKHAPPADRLGDAGEERHPDEGHPLVAHPTGEMLVGSVEVRVVAAAAGAEGDGCDHRRPRSRSTCRAMASSHDRPAGSFSAGGSGAAVMAGEAAAVARSAMDRQLRHTSSQSVRPVALLTGSIPHSVSGASPSRQ